MTAEIAATRVTLGRGVALQRGIPGGFVYALDSDHFFLDDPPRPATSSDYTWSNPPLPPGPFERADFGKVIRLSWPAGACGIPDGTKCGFWGERFAVWSEDRTLGFADATRSTIVRWALPEGVHPRFLAPFVHDGMLVFDAHGQYLLLRLSEVEGLFERESGHPTLVIRDRYPLALEGHVQSVRVAGIERDGRVRVVPTTRYPVPLWLPKLPGVVPDMILTLRHRLAADQWLEVELPDGRTFPTGHRREVEGRVPTELVIAESADPAGRHRAGETPIARQAELDRLFGDLADAPDDAATRMVLIDALEQEGATYAPLFAAMLAGDTSPTTRLEALGTLASFLTGIDYRHGLPFAATLATDAPGDDAIATLVGADPRIGFLHTLGIGEGAFATYARLVGAPRAVGLRVIDAPRPQIIKALIAAGRTRLTRIRGVKFANREMIQLLADPTFDRLPELEVDTNIRTISALLDYVRADELGFFGRAPRHLVLRMTDNTAPHLAQRLAEALPTLPLAALSAV